MQIVKFDEMGPIKNLQQMPHGTLKFLVSPSGNRTPVSRVTGGDTYHYTNEDCLMWRLLPFLDLLHTDKVLSDTGHSYRPYLKDKEMYCFQFVCQFKPRWRKRYPHPADRGGGTPPILPDRGYPHPSQWGVGVAHPSQ